MNHYRQAILRAGAPVTKAIGHLYLPRFSYHLNASTYHAAFEMLEVGDILIAKTYWHLTNLFLGKYPHAAIYAGNGLVIEAIGRGVVATDLIDFVLGKDELRAFRPTFADSEARAEAVEYAVSQIGVDYDFIFDPGRRAWYCAELVYLAYAKAAMKAGAKFRRENIWGEWVFTPANIATNPELWEPIFYAGPEGAA